MRAMRKKCRGESSSSSLPYRTLIQHSTSGERKETEWAAWVPGGREGQLKWTLKDE